MKKSFLKNNLLVNGLEIVFITLLSLGSYWFLLKPGYFPMHDDIQVIRLHQMFQCFLDGQIPCRWASDLTGGLGQPLFNFYAPFPFYLGAFFHLLGFSFIDSVKALFALSFALSGVFMYFLGKTFFGRLGAVTVSFLYVYAPYHAVDIYVRGAMSESWALVFFPLIFWFFYLSIKDEKYLYFVLSIFSLSFLILSHSIMNLSFFPVAFFWAIYWLVALKKVKLFPKVISVFVLAFLLAGFFILPALLEKSLVRIESLMAAYYDFRLHFVTSGQLFFSRFWGYGSSLGAQSGMSFQIGWPHWWLVVLMLPLSFLLYLKKEKRKALLFLFLIVIFFAFAFMTHRKSILIWETLPFIPFVQFPWRFLGIIIFLASFISGGIFDFLKCSRAPRFVNVLFTILVIVLTAYLNLGYFQPKEMIKINDEEKLSGYNWQSQQMGALIDYLPKTVQKVPEKPVNNWPIILNGQAKISNFQKRSNFWQVNLRAENGGSVVEVPVLDFPVWEVFLDQKKADCGINNESGVIRVSVPEGDHIISSYFRNTTLRTLANLLTVLTFLILVMGFVRFRSKKF